MGSRNIFEFALISIKVLIETSTFRDSADFSVSHDERARKVFLSVRLLSIAFQIPDLFSLEFPNLSLDLNLLLNIVGSDKRPKLKNLFGGFTCCFLLPPPATASPEWTRYTEEIFPKDVEWSDLNPH